MLVWQNYDLLKRMKNYTPYKHEGRVKERGRTSSQGGYISGKRPMTVQLGSAVEISAAIG